MSTPIEQPEGFGDYLRETVEGAGYTLERFQKEHGIALWKNVLGHERVTREKLDRLLQSLPLSPEKKIEIEARYEGQDLKTLRSVVIAGIRRYTQEAFAKRAGISVSALTYILNGDARRRDGEVHEVRWTTWEKIAAAMNIGAPENLFVWRKHARDVLGGDDIDPLGLEMELLFARRPDVSMHKWRDSRPEPYKDMTVRAFQKHARSLRAGEVLPWSETETFLKVLAPEPVETTAVATEWLKKTKNIGQNERSKLGYPAADAAMRAARLVLLKQIAASRPKRTEPDRQTNGRFVLDERPADDDGEEPDVDTDSIINRDDFWDDEEVAGYDDIFVDRD